VPTCPSDMGNVYNQIILICHLKGCFIVRFEMKLGAILGRNFDVTIGRAACEALQCNLEFGCQLSICSGIEEYNGKTLWSLSVAGPFWMQTDF
jgi:hypothetical protein